ncbi:MAG: YafY family transcriptional regulator [Alphaproteobacteria bacterium]|nr:YafY family transcriptional regulator [Alphaproteobacteria bacterium]MBU1517057.1 YafY family transcriptional regulator [Alphaproteobacteria bacterium]MBU2093676.1 YafY family transcriptional regulator [Alphaproteobacteria bacterium]MBU2154002.1 YafY family transcriptional regulator [Alphaproteobacteria bacterium]MBU2308724.1 YafY family transcriptional regulator [Alphaproteobacteria bacterium]
MRRADRLFQIIQILRRGKRPITADAIAEELETSKRTVYRDIADLIGQRAPIRGEAGVGYILEDGFDMPPLMLTPDEVEAAVLGAQMVAARGDPALRRAAEDLIAKIGAVIPENLRPLVVEPATRAAPNWKTTPDNIDMPGLRQAIRAGSKVVLTYRDEQDRETGRTVWPFAIGYYETSRMIMAWCEMRGDFRSFRTDRVSAARFTEDRYPDRPASLRARWRRHQQEQWAAMQARMACKAAE